MSSASPSPLGGADCPGSWRGADAADSLGRVFTFSLKFDIERLRLGRDSSNEVSVEATQRRPGSRPTITRTQGQEGLEDLRDNWYGCDRQYRAFASSIYTAVE